jgi:hypothetical protein
MFAIIWVVSMLIFVIKQKTPKLFLVATTAGVVKFLATYEN